jgi:hypothetical protein
MILRTGLFVAAALLVSLNTGSVLLAEKNTDLNPTGGASTEDESMIAVPLNEERILKVIPDFQTVEDSSRPVARLTPAEKWRLGWKEAIDPFNAFNAAFTSAFSQRDNQTPRYGEGWANYGRRFGAAIGDFGTQSLLSAGVFAPVCLPER